MGLGLFVIAAGVISTLLFIRPEPIQRDTVTLCPSTGITGVTAVLIDTTDGITPVSKADALNQLSTIVRSTAPGELVEVFQTAPIVGEPLPSVTTLCNPGSPDLADPLISNPVLVQQRWDQQFEGPLDELFTELLHAEEATTSPLMESIQSIAVTSFGKLGRQTVPKTLVVVSDLLQNTSNYSHYSHVVDFGSFSADTDAYRALAADLRGVDVEILYLQRKTERAISGNDVVNFWYAWLDEHGAGRVHTTKLAGLN